MKRGAWWCAARRDGRRHRDSWSRGSVLWMRGTGPRVGGIFVLVTRCAVLVFKGL